MPNETIPTIKRTGVIFRPGDYGAVNNADDVKAGKKGVYSEADMHLLAGDDPVPIKMSHLPTIMDGKLGQCTRRFVGFDDSGKQVLMGEWEEPEPLNQLLGDTRRSVSIEVFPLSKKVNAVALEVNPHITDAAFFSQALEEAYVRFSKGEEIEPLASFAYESSAERDAIPDNSWRQTNGVSQPLGSDYAMYSNQEKTVMNAAEFKGKVFVQHEAGKFQQATPEELVAFTGGKIEVVATAPEPEKAEPKTPRELELEAKVAKFEADTSAEKTRALEAAAVAKADALVESGVIEAKGNEAYNHWLAAFSVAGKIDAQREELALFSADSPHAAFSLTDHLDAMVKNMKKHDGTEQVSGLDPSAAGGVAVFEQNKTTVTDPQTGDAVEIVDARLKKERAEFLEAQKSAR